MLAIILLGKITRITNVKTRTISYSTMKITMLKTTNNATERLPQFVSNTYYYYTYDM